METGKVFSIAVLGPSTKGKTTYIASLCEKNVSEKLRGRTKGNTKGQTKIACYYHFTVGAENGSDANTSGISEICIYRERLMPQDDGAFDGAVQKLLQKIGVTEEKLRECLAEENYLVRIPVNHMPIPMMEELDKEEYSKIIHNIALDVKGSEAFEKCLKDEGVREIVVRDVRGFGDEYLSDDELKDMQEDREKRMAYYGYEDVDAIILFNIKGGAFSGKTNKMYMGALEDAIALKPVVVLEHSDLLRSLMVDGKKTYGEIMENEKDSIWDTEAFDVIDRIIADVIDKNKAHLYSDIIWQYVRHLFIPEIAMKKEEHRAKYCEAVVGSFGYLLRDIKQFKGVVEKFSEDLRPKMIYDLGMYFPSALGRRLPTEFQSHLADGRWYDMTGVNGGLTTWIKGKGRVGETIIQVMKGIYDAVDGFLKARFESGRGNGDKLTVEQQQEILVYSIIDKFLHSYELFLDWRDTIFPAAKESIVRDNFDKTYSFAQQSGNVEREIAVYFVNCVMCDVTGRIESMEY